MRRSHIRTRDIVSLSGWLFADLFLVLAMLFFLSSVTISRSDATAPALTPTPTTVPPLSLKKLSLSLTIDPSGLLGRSPTAAAVHSIEQQLRNRASLHNRRAGLVIGYDGAPTDSNISAAQTVVGNIYAILKMLGHQNYVFQNATYYASLYVLGTSPTHVTLDIFLFAQ
ncbi:MAG TPA: hypothetical protein VGF67_17645 [Ktedonobacteraceae bacterium]|jgi:hypothetical protein